jgi:UDP-N-acetylmuramoyl-L-alanyl-D-glutamate--2,6-diaminopimelate ligase
MNKIEKAIQSSLNIQWKVELSNKDSLLFYIASNKEEKSQRMFEERLKKANYNYVITNLKSTSENVISLNQEDCLRSMKTACDKFYPLPRYCGIAITGTNGKTTTADIIRQLLVLKNKNVLMIGTLGIYKNENKVDDFKLTSPHYVDLRAALAQNLKDNEFLVIESSSHALHQKRQYGLKFDAIGFTSFSQDHLDYHKNMEDYFAAKLLLQRHCDKPFVISKSSHLLKEKLKSYREYEVQIDHSNEYLKVSYNKINLDVSIGCLNQVGVSVSENEINKLKSSPGRFNIIKNKEQIFVIDFAHTPESLENILMAIKETYKKEIVCVFGCGGNRDRSKRKIMGEIAERGANFSIITTDNPRFEEPVDIIKDIEKGFSKKNFISIVDRHAAIKYAFDKFKDHVILVAGKGHEEYIDAKGVRTFFSDYETIRELM